MLDYYKVLKISKSASDDEIKNAYRKLAKSHHPDKGGDKDHFQKIQEAYEILSDPIKRKNYDNPNENLNNIFPFDFNNHPFFAQHRNPIIQKNDYIYNCHLTLDEVYTGTLKKFRVQRNKPCTNCNNLCSDCNGTGQRVHHTRIGLFSQTIRQICQTCKGSGKNANVDTNCEICSNKNIIHEEKIFEINIKPGVESGTKITFEEWGEQATHINERSGSFIVHIIVDDHKDFKRSGLNLIYIVKLTLRESIVGKQITINHFSDKFVIDTQGFGIINPNQEYIVYDKGLINETGQLGNLILKFQIEYTNHNFNNDQIKLLNSIFDQVHLK